ncbi:MAG: hypothetical protein MUC96_02920 [Myxococcaceae bacterium]|jgi:hypothetical protein|nr:hypothetical protein [Myxococcaceae bacterium]
MLLTVSTFAFFYCLGISWLLQVVVYPTYRLVGKAEFVPFHVSQGRRMGPVMIAPMFLTSLVAIVNGVLERGSAQAPYLWGAAACGAVVIATTLASELPKHLKLDKHGKDDALIEGLIRDNLPRTLAWTVGAGLLVAAQRSVAP